jgi:predicted Zn-dependent protease
MDRQPDMTSWIEPSEALAERLALPAVPLPVSDRTADDLRAGRFDPAVAAAEVDAWLSRGDGPEAKRAVLARWTASLAYVAGVDFLDHGEAATAAHLFSIGVRRADDDPSLRAMLGLARWDCHHQVDAIAHLALAVDQYAAAGQVAPMLNILTARALSEAGRHQLALDLLEVLAATEPRVPLFWDLVEAIGQRV